MQRFHRTVNNDGSITFTFDFGHEVSLSDSDKYVAQVLRDQKKIYLTEREKLICQAKTEHWPSILLLISKNQYKQDIKNLFEYFVEENLWETVKKMISAGVHPDTPLDFNKTALQILLYQRSKKSLELFKFFLDHGASPHFISQSLNFAIIQCMVHRLQLDKFRMLLPYFTSTLNSCHPWREYCVLYTIFQVPNYHKFRCLLVHGMNLYPNKVEEGLHLMMKKKKPNSPDHWRRNQHKRKIVADIKAWPRCMLMYSFEKRSLPVFWLS